MQTLTPSVQNEAEGTESVGETAQAEIHTPEPLISGPAPALWAGVGSFMLIFFIGMMLVIRGRVTGPAKRRAEAANTTYFEPAGEDADISFDEDQEPLASPTEDSEEDEGEPVMAHDANHDDVVDEEFEYDPEEPPAKPEKKRSPFAGLFGKKKAEEKHAPQLEDVSEDDDYDSDDGFFAPTPEEEPDPATVVEDVEPVEPAQIAPVRSPDNSLALRAEQQRTARAEQAAELAQKRAEDAEAALTDRTSEFHEMERRLAELSREMEENTAPPPADALPIQAAAVHPFGAVSDAPSVSEAHFAEFADLMGEQFDALRGAVNGSIEKLSRRIDSLPSAQSGAVTATAARVQLSDLLGDALAPGRFKLGHKLSTDRTADAVIVMPGPMAPIAIDARFPVEAFDAWQLSRNAGTETELRRAILRHITGAAEKLIAPKETADCAMMFVPSENILSELHAHFSDLVQESYRAHVWMVSPTSLMATLHTISAVMAGAGIKEMSAVNVIDELHSLRGRIAALETQHTNSADQPTPEEAPEIKVEPAAEHVPTAVYKTSQYGDIFENVATSEKPGAEGDEKSPFPLR